MVEWLNNVGQDALAPFLTAFFTVAVLAFIKSKLRGSGDAEPTERGTIRFSRIMIWSVAIIGVLFCLLFAAFMHFDRTDPILPIVGPIVILMFGVMIVISLITMSPYYDLVWDSEGVEGPAKQFSIGWRVDRNRIEWAKLDEHQTKPNGVICLKSDQGEKVFYSQFHSGYGGFEATLKSKRPDMF